MASRENPRSGPSAHSSVQSGATWDRRPRPLLGSHGGSRGYRSCLEKPKKGNRHDNLSRKLPARPWVAWRVRANAGHGETFIWDCL